ncbi:MAG: cadherin-like beta sandwich domain-containing protein [Clostridiaceae bacterium]|nr:cadherin-like beta sandwich domain-containing protein [Clostridiaceae bacterium]
MSKKRRIHICIVLLACVVSILVSPIHNRVSADESVTINLSSSASQVKPGDSIAISVTFNHFPRLTRFGPIEVQFDTGSVSYTGMTVSSSLPSTFSVVSSETSGVVVISGTDVDVEAQIQANKLIPTTDEQGQPVEPPADPSMLSSDSVLICTLNFVVLDAAKSETRFWLSNSSGFKDSSEQPVNSVLGSFAAVSVDTPGSSDASLASLSLDAGQIEPAFSPTIYDYRVSVPRSISNVVVSATPLDIKSQVIISGQNNLVVGENQIRITVVAQNVVSTQEYRISVVREESYIPSGASITDPEGRTFMFIDIPDTLIVPLEFYPDTIRIGKYDLPAYSMEGLKEVLLYLQNPEGEAGLFAYSPTTGTLIEFDPQKSFFRASVLFSIQPVTDSSKIPGGFEPISFIFSGRSVEGYESKDGKTRILYLSDDDGAKRFYVVDAQTNEIYPYIEHPEPPTSVYLILFVIFFCIAVVEASTIAIIIYQLRKRRTIVTPRVRRV